MKRNEIDKALMTQLKDRAAQLKSDNQARDSMFARYDEMYLLDWKKKNDEKLQHMQVTASTSFRSAVSGAVRLLVATDPLVNVTESDDTKGVNIERVESFLTKILHHSGRHAGEPVHYALLTTGILYDEFHASISSTQDMLEFARQAKVTDETSRLYKNASIKRWEEIAATNPWLIEPTNPKFGYPEWGPTGLEAYYRVVQTTVGKVRDQFGQLPEGLQDAARHQPVFLHTFYDQVFTAIWLDQGDLFLKPHGLPRIPVAVQILNGSRIFENEEDQRQPMGYALAKANLWNAQSLLLTVMMTAVLNMGATPTKVYYPAAENSTFSIDYDNDVIRLHQGDRLEFVINKGLIDPAQIQLNSLIDGKVQENTIYPQALGQAVERTGSTYSELALLAQSGRLPLIGPQRRGGWGFSGIFETILSFMRDDQKYRKGTPIEASDLAKGMEIDVKLDVALPQDKLQQANIAQLLTQGDDPLTSHQWALEKVLNVTNPEKMRRQIWDERGSQMMYTLTMQHLAQQAMQQQQEEEAKRQAQLAAQQGGGMTPGGPATPGQGAQPEMPGPGGVNPGAQPGPVGAPMQGGLPQAQAGLIPGPGQPPMIPSQQGGFNGQG